jgi:hypothetical protein
MHLRSGLALALVLPCLLAACGSSAPTATRRSSAPQTVTRTVPRASSTPTTSSAQTGTAQTQRTSTESAHTTAATADQCVASDLSLSFLGGNGATGHAELGFALRNRSSSSCRTGGYPGVLFLDAAGHGLTTRPDHTTSDFFGHTTLSELTVAPGATVSFRLGVSHVGSGGSDTGCVTARGVQVIPPNDTATLRVMISGGLSECGGTVTVSPIQAGTSAFH